MKSLAIFLLMGVGVASAQMTIRPNSSVYVDDVVLYVDQGIDIQNTGNLYLRRDAQLLQSRTKTTSTNSGTGMLSVYQEGTSDGYDYNYWCAPVGVADGVSGNRPFSLAQIYQPTSVVNSVAALTTSGLNGIASPLTISSYWIWTFVASTDYSQWVHAGTGPIAPGLGFTMKGTDGADPTTILGVQNNDGSGHQRYDFRGRPNDGNINVNVAPGQWTLTGNPYPSALNVDAFLLDPGNTAINATAYYWEHQKNVNSHFLEDYQGGYGTYVPGLVGVPGDGVYTAAFINTYNPDGSVNTPGVISSGLSVRRDYAPIGQGFMVEGVTSGTVTFKNAHREYYREGYLLSTFERSPNAHANAFQDNRMPHLRLNAIINEYSGRELALILVPFATDGVDRGLDGKSPDGNTLAKDAAFYLDNEFYAIEGVAFNENKRVPLVVKADQPSMFSFSMPDVINFDPFQPVYIYDALDSSYHSLNNGGTYEVMVPAGTHTNRFEVTFRDAALSVPGFNSSALQIVQNNTVGELIISNPDGYNIKKCQVYDMAGRLVMQKADVGPALETRLATNGLSEAVYIVKVLTGDKDFGQKISVYRPK